MKRQVSPAIVVGAVVLTFAAVLTIYWKGLIGGPGDGDMGPMGGGGGMPPPPIVGLPNVAVTTVSGPVPRSPEAGDAGYADGSATLARFDGPNCVAVAPDGSVLVADARNHRIRRVAPDGTVTTLAGSGPTAATLGSFADGPSAQARFWNPSGIALGPGGTLLIADTGNHHIRALTRSAVKTLAGSETPADRLGLPDGGLADGPGRAAQFRYPTDVAILSDGSALVVDCGNRRIRKVAPDGAVSTFADLAPAGAKSPCGIALLPDGRALVTDPAAEAVFQVSVEGQVSALPGIDKNAPIWVRPTGIAADAAGVVYIADTGSHCIMRLRPGAAPHVLAGIVEIMEPGPGYSNGGGDQSAFAAPCAVAMAGQNVLYVADFGNNCIRKVVIGPEG